MDSLPKNEVHGSINWERRYAHMRMHSAQHLLSAIVLDEYNGETVGNQIYADHSRIDFALDKINSSMVEGLANEFNKAVDEEHDVIIYTITREELNSYIAPSRMKLFERIPESVVSVRVVDIKGIDKCPCAGTHIANTGEIGHIRIIETKTKGKGKTRLVFELEQAKI